MVTAIAELEGQGVMGIAGDCGFMVHYQQEVRALCTVPAFVSSVLQAAMLGVKELRAVRAQGISLNARCVTLGATAIIHAAHRGVRTAVKHLMAVGAAGLELRTTKGAWPESVARGSSAMHAAATNGHSAIVSDPERRSSES